VLKVGHDDLWTRRCLRRSLPRVRHHADDLHPIPRFRCHPGADDSPQRIVGAEGLPRQSLVHDGDLRTPKLITIAEIPAETNWSVHGVEVSRRDDLKLGQRALVFPVGRAPIDRIARGRSKRVEWHRHHTRRMTDTR